MSGDWVDVDEWEDIASPVRPDFAAGVGPFQAGAIATGKGFYNVGRGIGLLDPADETEQQAFGQLEAKYPKITTVGQAVGEAAPFLPAGGLVGAIPKTAARVAAGAALGATEGGVIAGGRGADAFTGAMVGGALGGTGEVLLPYLVRAGNSLFRKVTGRAPAGAVLDNAGVPTAEFQKILDDSGLSLDDLAKQEIQRLQQSGQMTPAMAERVARFWSEGAPATLGDITQDYGQQVTEARLFESANDSFADPMRAKRLEQSQALRGSLDGMAGDADNMVAGASVKDALSAEQRLLERRRGRYYKIASGRAEQLGDEWPIYPDAIKASLPDAQMVQTARLLSNSSGQMTALDNLFVNFGIDKSEESLKALYGVGNFNKAIKNGKSTSDIYGELVQAGKVTPLTVKNMEIFRKGLNDIYGADTRSTGGAVVKNVINGLDREVDEMIDVLDTNGVVSPVIDALKKGRATHRQIQTEFSPQSIVGKLTGVRPDGVSPIIEASNVSRTLMGRAGSVENLGRTLDSLMKAPGGRKAIADMQSSTVLDLVNSAFSTQSKKVLGETVFNPIAYNNKLKELAQNGKLQTLFRDNPAIYQRLVNIGKIGQDMTPPSGAVPKGSANVILDSLNQLGILGILGRIPGGGLMAQGIGQLAKNRQTTAAVGRAIDPQLGRVRTVIEQQFPQLASALGIPVLLPEEEE